MCNGISQMMSRTTTTPWWSPARMVSPSAWPCCWITSDPRLRLRATRWIWLPSLPPPPITSLPHCHSHPIDWLTQLARLHSAHFQGPHCQTHFFICHPDSLGDSQKEKTALMYACSSNRESCVHKLLHVMENNIDQYDQVWLVVTQYVLDFQELFSSSVLHQPCWNRNQDKMTWKWHVVNHSHSDSLPISQDNMTAFAYAASVRKWDLARLLLDHGANVNVQGGWVCLFFLRLSVFFLLIYGMSCVHAYSSHHDHLSFLT